MGYIGPYATNNYPIIRFKLKLGTELIHTFRINWMKKFRTIVPCLMKNGVTFYSPWILKIAG